MAILFLAWYVQDLMQVLLSTAFLAPEIFLLALNAKAVEQEEINGLWYIIPFFGGMLFDLRWTSLPGLCAGLFVVAHYLFRLFWYDFLPRDGRTTAPFVFLSEVTCLLLLVIRMAFWRGDGTLGHLLGSGLFALLLTQLPLWLIALTARFEDDTPHF